MWLYVIGIAVVFILGMTVGLGKVGRAIRHVIGMMKENDYDDYHDLDD